jgi:hypothetical protein
MRRTGKPAQAVAASLEHRKLCGTDPNALLTVARELALAAKLVGQGKARLTPAEAEERNKYGGLAVETLRLALKHGFRNVEALNKHPDLAVLRGRPDFQTLLAGVKQ